MRSAGDRGAPPRGKALALLSLGALGVVYGDIGTSPLYAMKECFSPLFGVTPTRDNVLGVLSLIFWSLNLVISTKYLGFVLRADNRGEGGVVALLALLRPSSGRARGARRLAIVAGVFGTALLYGDGLITPVISVLGAMEGITVVAPQFNFWVPWITISILVALFLVQRRGTARVGALWGPITSLWFLSIATWGVYGIVGDPSVLAAVNPWHAVTFFAENGRLGFVVLGAVFLVVTGGEALYADIGHFGKRPIRLMWFTVVLPALLLNYFGQGALLLDHPEAAANPFFNLPPSWARYPMLLIATGAAITASQALISGAYSLTQQAVQLGYIPRLTIRHTSKTHMGQIYMPEVNWVLMVGCVALVLGFRSTENIAGAYGLAVTLTFAITTILFCGVLLDRWKWPVWRVALVGVPMLAVDLAFLGANLPKVTHGGWFTLVVGTLAFMLMTTWKAGRRILAARQESVALPLELFAQDVARKSLPRVTGTAIFLTSDASGAPPVLLHHLKHNKVLHERVLVMSLLGEEEPTVSPRERLEVKDYGQGLWQVKGHYGFMETPHLPALLAQLAEEHDIALKLPETSFYLGRETLLPTGKSRLSWWRKRLFIVMARNARSAAAYFDLPPNRVVELGTQIQL